MTVYDSQLAPAAPAAKAHFGPIEPLTRSLPEQIAARLAERILAGVYAPGERVRLPHARVCHRYSRLPQTAGHPVACFAHPGRGPRDAFAIMCRRTPAIEACRLSLAHHGSLVISVRSAGRDASHEGLFAV